MKLILIEKSEDENPEEFIGCLEHKDLSFIFLREESTGQVRVWHRDDVKELYRIGKGNQRLKVNIN